MNRLTAAMRVLRLTMWCCGALTASADAAETPFSLTLHFDFFYNGIRAAEVTEIFSTDADGGYEITSHAAALGLAKLLYGDIYRKSTGRIDPADGLRLLHFEVKRGTRPPTVAEVDEAAGVVHLRKGEEQRSETVPEVLLVDYLTALYRPYILQKMTPGQVAVTNGWRLKVYEYMTGDSEEVQTAAGVFAAVPLFRESPRGPRVFWFAPSLNYLPIKTRVDEKGHIFETILTKIGSAEESAKEISEEIVEEIQPD